MRRLLVGPALALAILGCELHDPNGRSAPRAFSIGNRSSRTLTEIRLSMVAERSWEPSLVAPLRPGDEVTAAPIACGRYDVLFVNDGAAQCVLPMQQLCFRDEPWWIDDVTLASCRWTH